MKIKSNIGILALLSWAALAGAQTVETVTTNGLFEPYGVTVDLSTNVYYFTDSANNSVMRYDTANNELTTLVTLVGVSNNFAAYPQGIVLARSGLVVSDYASHALYEITFDGDLTLLAGGARGLVNGKTDQALFNSPAGLAVDDSGNIFIADLKNNVIRRLAPDDTVTTYATGFYEPAGVAVGNNGLLFVTDTRNNTIKVVQTDGKVSLIAGRPGFAGSDDGVGSVASFNGPRGLLWVGGETGLLVSDSGNNTIRRVYFKSGAWRVETFAGLPGTPSYANGDLSAARFNSPLGLALDAEGSIVLADLYNNALRRIKRVLPPLPVIAPLGGSFSNAVSIAITSGASNTVFYYTTDGTTPNPLSFSTPADLSFDGGPVQLAVRGVSPDFATSGTVSNTFSFFVNPLTVSVAGGTFTNDVAVSVSTLTSNAVIRATTDGSVPQTNSPVWSDRVLSASGPLMVRAFREGYTPTPVVSNYFNFVVAQPVIAPNGAITNDAVEITLNSDTVGAKLYWTIDKSDPTTSSALYTGPFLLQTNGTLKVKGFKNGYAASATTSADFNLTVSTPTILPAGATTNNVITVEFSDATPGAKLYWTIDGKEPTTTSALYDGPFTLGTNGALKVKGFRNGFVTSATASAQFSFIAAAPVITPASSAANNAVDVTLDSVTVGAEIYWTIDGSEPGTTSARYTGPFSLAQSGTLKAKAFKPGFAASPTSSGDFRFTVAAPAIQPNGANANDAVPVTLTTTTAGAKLFWTIDGSEPTASSALYTDTFLLGTNGTLKVKSFKNGFADSATTSASFNLVTAPPVLTPVASTNVNTATVTLSSKTPNAKLYFTTDGSEPTTSSTLYAAPVVIVTNTVLKAMAVRDGFVASPSVAGNYFIQVDRPTLSPGNGFFPNGTTVTFNVARPNASLYYTLNGEDPTTDDTLYTGPFQLNQVFNQGADLRTVKVRAFAPDTLPSAVASGQPVPANAIGFPRDVVAGVGSTVVVPVVVNLQSNQVLRSLQFRIEVSPSATAPKLLSDLRALNITSNDFVQVVGPGASGPALLNTSPYSSGSTKGLVISAIGTNANFAVHDFATVTMLAINVPANASVGDQYQIDVLQPSGTSDGQQAPVKLASLGARSIIVSNISYVVGDSSLGAWYNAGDFGDGNLDNSDVNNAFYASLGVRVPYAFSDVFDAMDAFPDDTPGAVGGDGQIRFLDWQRILSRSLRRDPNNWRRTWSPGGTRIASSATLNAAPNRPAEMLGSKIDDRAWTHQAVVSAGLVENAKPGSVVNVPVYVNVREGNRLAGLQFRSVIESDGPVFEQPMQFVTAKGFSQPILLNALPFNQVAGAWPLVPAPAFSPALQDSNLLGHIQFTIPATASAGTCYTIRFANVDGSPDANTQYDLETLPGCVWVGTPAGQHTFVPEEWRVKYFGNATNPLADANADADGDGVPNWQEFLSGTNPAKLRLQVLPDDGQALKQAGFKLRWFGASGKRYVIECTADLHGSQWRTIANGLSGAGRIQEFTDTNVTHRAQFYRVREQQP